MIEKSLELYKTMEKRRTWRQFQNKPVSLELIKNCVLTAGTAPSGANMQPWHFEIILSPDLKKKIRNAAEMVEKDFYLNKAPEEWKNALSKLKTDFSKPFLEEAPCLIGIFVQKYHVNENGEHVKHYYIRESVGIATGMLISALHLSGLAALTYTPSPMYFMNDICQRPDSESPYMIIVTGYPDEKYELPSIERKSFSQIAKIRE